MAGIVFEVVTFYLQWSNKNSQTCDECLSFIILSHYGPFAQFYVQLRAFLKLNFIEMIRDTFIVACLIVQLPRSAVRFAQA